MKQEDAKKNKFKVQITSDGTATGTKVVVNGESITDLKNVTNVHFNASGGVKWDANDKMSPYISFGYDVLNKNDDGSEIGESFSFTPNETMERGTIGPVKEKMNDTFVGKDSEIINKILELKPKIPHYLPTKDELEKRSYNSLIDMLNDIEKEVKNLGK